MISNIRLLFYGDSIFLAGLKAALATAVPHHHPFITKSLPADSPNALDHIRAYHPQAIIFDLTAPNLPIFAIPLLREQPDLLLIGLDPCRDDLLVLSGQSSQAVHINDLITILSHQETAV
ncbi:MAG: hypothetical protein KC415_18230 [Anaerolineales bacterium]|nr:hypothetical protein [Anaerolineales bacterium]MCB8983699.1 hypothetical protein [Ardenticatenaceae bacterium]